MRGGERGSAMIEAVLIFSMLIAIVLGLIDVGRRMMVHHFVAYAAREASRYASVHSSLSPQPATAESIQRYVRQLAVGVDPAGIQVKSEWSPANTPGSSVHIEVRAGESKASSQVTVLN